MQVNASAAFCFSDSSLYPFYFICYDRTFVSTSYLLFTCASLLLFLPIYVLVLWKGFQRWRQAGAAAAGSASHSDVFVYHSVSLEVVSVFGSCFYCVSIYTCSRTTLMMGYYMILLTYPGQTFFHCLTCVERYLAVVHPVTYRGLKKGVAVRVRNISICCVWLICSGMLYVSVIQFPELPTALYGVLYVIMVTIINFSSFSVLRALIRLGLWKVGGDRRQIDQSKQRAFHTVMAVLGTLVFRLTGLLLLLLTFNIVNERGPACVFLTCSPWFCLPSNLVLPLLFLCRAGTFSSSERGSPRRQLTCCLA